MMTLLRFLRRAKNLTVTDVATKLGINPATLSTVERHPQIAGRQLRQALSAFHGGAKYELLATGVNIDQLASDLLAQLEKQHA